MFFPSNLIYSFTLSTASNKNAKQRCPFLFIGSTQFSAKTQREKSARQMENCVRPQQKMLNQHAALVLSRLPCPKSGSNLHAEFIMTIARLSVVVKLYEVIFV